MTHYIEYGDIFSIEGVTNYAHGCNCQGRMGRGIAVQMKQKFPNMYKEYNHLCVSGKFCPGDIFAYNYGNGYVFNLATQEHYNIPGKLAKVKHINASMRKMMKFAEENDVKSIALPKIGAGLGGLNWNDVKAVIEEIASEYPNIDLYVVENYKPVNR